MAYARRRQVALAAAACLAAAVHAAAHSPVADRWFFGSIGSCEAGGGLGSAGRTHVRTHAAGLDFLVLSGDPEFPAAFVFPIMGGSCDSVNEVDSRAQSLLYLHYLNAGFRLAPAAVQRCERASTRRCKDARSRTAVLARSLSERAIVDAIRQRRVYASQDRNLEVLFSINGHPLGSVVPMRPGTPLRIEVRLVDPDEPSAFYWVSLRRDEVGGPLEADREASGTDLKGDGTIVFTQFQRGQADEYFLLQVSQGEGAEADVLWMTPIWLVTG
jgi:hypothetical protein